MQSFILCEMQRRNLAQTGCTGFNLVFSVKTEVYEIIFLL
jgi:hypothetical protein